MIFEEVGRAQDFLHKTRDNPHMLTFADFKQEVGDETYYFFVSGTGFLGRWWQIETANHVRMQMQEWREKWAGGAGRYVAVACDANGELEWPRAVELHCLAHSRHWDPNIAATATEAYPDPSAAHATSGHRSSDGLDSCDDIAAFAYEPLDPSLTFDEKPFGTALAPMGSVELAQEIAAARNRTPPELKLVVNAAGQKVGVRRRLGHDLVTVNLVLNTVDVRDSAEPGKMLQVTGSLFSGASGAEVRRSHPSRRHRRHRRGVRQVPAHRLRRALRALRGGVLPRRARGASRGGRSSRGSGSRERRVVA